MRKILVRAPNWLGDGIMSTPFLKRLAEKESGAEVHVLCPEGLAEIFRGAPGVRNVVPFSKDSGTFSLAGRLRREHFDEGYVLPPSFSSALLFFLAGIPVRIGYAADFRGPLLTRSLPLEERYHYVRRYLGLLGEPGRDVGPRDLYFPRPSGPAPQAAGARAFMESQKVPWCPPFFAVAPGSQAPARRWFPERFAEIINGLDEKEWPTILLLGAASDRPWAAAVEEKARRPVANLCGKTTLTVLGDVLRSCGRLVTNESGMMHVAWAVGTPTVVLAGPSDPRLTSSFGENIRVLQRREVPCVPCVRNECYRAKDDYMECMKKMDVAEVTAAVSSLSAPVASGLPG